MSSLDRFILWFSLAWLVLPVVGLLAQIVRRGSKRRLTRMFWVSWGNVLVLNLMALARNHISLLRGHRLLLLTGLVVWMIVLAWNLWRTNAERNQDEHRGGRVPIVYNDWAKPDHHPPPL